MEQYIIYTFGGIVFALCWFAVSTLKNLNKSLEGSTPENQKPAQGTKFERKEKIIFAIHPETAVSVKIPTIPMKGNKTHGAELFNGVLGCAHCHGSNAQGPVDNRNLRAIKKRYAGDTQKVYDTVMEIGRLGTVMPP